MEKISGILASSSRVNTVDLTDAHAVRPGAPSYGRKMGESSLAKNINRSSISSQRLNDPNLTFREKQNIKHVDLIKNLTDGFFMKKQERVAQINDEFRNDIYTNELKSSNSASALDLINEAKSEVDNILLAESMAPVSGVHEVQPAMQATQAVQSSGGEADNTPEYIRPGKYIDVEA